MGRGEVQVVVVTVGYELKAMVEPLSPGLPREVSPDPTSRPPSWTGHHNCRCTKSLACYVQAKPPLYYDLCNSEAFVTPQRSMELCADDEKSSQEPGITA